MSLKMPNFNYTQKNMYFIIPNVANMVQKKPKTQNIKIMTSIQRVLNIGSTNTKHENIKIFMTPIILCNF